jgi:hypothetical protein
VQHIDGRVLGGEIIGNPACSVRRIIVHDEQVHAPARQRFQPFVQSEEVVISARVVELDLQSTSLSPRSWPCANDPNPGHQPLNL